MIDIKVDDRIVAACPELRIGAVSATVVNSETSDALWGEIEQSAQEIKNSYELLEINKRPAVAATRHLYKTLGKDPGRYRMAAEQLCRRIIRGLGLYRLTTLIDITNLVSFRSGYSVSGLDADKLVGDTLTLGVGETGEVYHGIGRGELNIEHLPVYRDAVGCCATPTSDEERTKLELTTRHIQFNINGFGPEMPMEQAVTWMVDLLKRYASATEVETKIFENF